MRRYFVNLCMLLCLHLVLYSKSDICPEVVKSENLDCHTNYDDRISCIWYKGSDDGNGSFLLILKSNNYEDEMRMCDLVSSPYDQSFNCDLTNLTLDEMDNYKITVHDLSLTKDLAIIEEFYPRCNIKLDPPSDLWYNFTGTAYNVTWKGNNEVSDFTKIYFELQLKKEESNQKSIKTDISVTYAEIMLFEFHEGSNYIQIRSRTDNEGQYRSHWSEWSSELKIHVMETDKQSQDMNHIITIVTLLTMALIVLMLALRSILSTRINVSFWKKIPTAADFFHPLYNIHNGNFQDWTKHPNICKEKKKVRQLGSPQDIDLSATVLYVQREAVSAVKLESPLSKEEILQTPNTCNSMSWSDPLVEKEIYLNGIYPVFFSSFSNDIINETVSANSLDCPMDYFSYEGNYIANSHEIAE
ncbi:interleukin-9 receptor-like [Ranitomeya imitator]|uniref:interleukin-9 receptor-like n=1 Tax=Ranitomeya imitator TaxID=111125 RepID=UPI0037E7E189